MIEFPPFRLDLIAGRLWRGDHPVALRPKAWVLLCFLTERPGALVTKDDLHKAVWGDAVVSDATLTQTLAELRQALQDDARAPRVIETVHGRGFRFIARVTGTPDGDQEQRTALASGASRGQAPPAGALVGRDIEMATLRELFRQAAAGQRQVAVIQGEPGIGKTALVEAFLDGVRAAAPHGVLIGYAQCVEQSGPREPYMPVLEALERMGQGPEGTRLLPILRQVAPSWLTHMPALQTPAERRRGGHSEMAPNRMLREFANLVDALPDDRPLVLVLDDLHWSDHSTVDLVSVVAQRPEPARAMLVATYRPAEAAALDHPVGPMLATLRARSRCTDMALEYLSHNDVRAYLGRRFHGAPVAAAVAIVLHEHTDGNPLFLVALVDHLLARGWLAEDGGVWRMTVAPTAIAENVPDSLTALIEGQRRFASPAEADALEAASVVGVAFDAIAVGAALDRPPDEVDTLCARLSDSHRWLRPLGSRQWPDGSLAGRYAFTHSLYQRVLYERLPPSRRAMLHRRIGEKLEAGHAGRIDGMSAELATHFERGGDRRRAVVYLRETARRGQDRGAYRDVVACLDRALHLIRDLPETPERDRDELDLRQQYSAALAQTAGYSADAQLENLMRSRRLCQQLGDTGALFDVLHALGFLLANRGDCARAGRIAEQLAQMSERLDTKAVLQAWYMQGATALWRGDLGGAEPLLARVLSSPVSPENADKSYGVNPIIAARSVEGLRQWLAGDADGARAIHREALALAERLGRPFTLAQALTFATMVLLLDEQWGEASKLATRAIDLSEEYGFPRWLGTARVCHGRAVVEEGADERGLDEIRGGLDLLQGARLNLGDSLLFSFFARACLRLNRVDEGLAAADSGLAHCRDTTERLFEAELWRLRGEAMLRQAADQTHAQPAMIQDAEACLAQARAVAQAQGALMLERRASRWAAGVTAFQSPAR